MPADGSAGCLLLWMETPVAVASAASPMVLGLGGVAGDIVMELCVEGITPKEPVWLAGEGILCRIVMELTSHFPSFSRLVWSWCEPEAIVLGATGWHIS